MLLAIACLGLSVIISLYFFQELNTIVIMIGVTSLGIGLSFIKKIRNTSNSFSIGQYLIYMFSLAIGLSFDLSHINKEIFTLLLFFCTVQFGSVALHMLLSKLFHIDGKITLITSTAGIYGQHL
jgi:hypothetical protein